MPESRQAFQELQYQFAAHLRDPDKNPAPSNIEDRRMEIYRDLLYRNVEGFIAKGFPVTHKLYNDAHWHKMIRHFFSHHQSHSPYFKDISKEFIEYLSNERDPQPEDPPFLLELVHYEWLEIMLTFVDVSIDWEHIDRDGDVMRSIPELSPLIQLKRYDYPVHAISPNFQPEKPAEQPTFLIVYRDQQDKVGFMEVNPMTARLIELLSDKPQKSGEQILRALAQEFSTLQENVILHGGHKTLIQLREKDIILGTRHPQ